MFCMQNEISDDKLCLSSEELSLAFFDETKINVGIYYVDMDLVSYINIFSRETKKKKGNEMNQRNDIVLGGK